MIKLILITIFWIFGIHAITREDKLFGFISVYFNGKTIDPLAEINTKISERIDLFLDAMYDEVFDPNQIDIKSTSKEAFELYKDLEKIHSRKDKKENQEKQISVTKKILEFISPALTECIICMSSIHSLFIYFYTELFNDSILMLPIYMISVSGALYIICSSLKSWKTISDNV